MRYSVMGFNQAKVIETDLDLTDLMLLNYIICACGTPNMYHKLDSNGNPLVWISHAKLMEDLPIIRISEGTLKNRLTALRQNGYIKSIVVAGEIGRGSRTYYGITEMTTSLIYDVETPTTSRKNDVEALPRHEKMTPDNLLKKDDNKLNREEEVENFLNAYNNTCTKLPSVRKVSDKRKKAIKNIVNKYSKEEIQEVFNKTNESDFLTGRNDRGWKADIDFLLREDKFISILEGKYDSNKSRTDRRKFGETSEVISKSVTQEEIDNGYFTGEVY